MAKSDLTIIMGCGFVGIALASRLAMNGQNLVILDVDDSAFGGLPVDFAGLTVVGDGTSLSTLKQIEIHRAGTFMAVTRSDSKNIMAAQVASKICAVPRVIAMIRNPDRIALCRELGVVPISSTAIVAGACIEALHGDLSAKREDL